MELHISEYVVRSSIVELKGRVDLHNAYAIKAELNSLLDAGLREFIVDLSAIQFIDCAGLSVLANLLKRTREYDGSVRLVPPKKQQPRRLLALTRFDRLFELIDSAESLLPASAEKVHSAPAI